MSFDVFKTAPSIVFCPEELIDAINADVTIVTFCEDVTVDDEVNLTITFEGTGPLSGAEDTALNALIAAFQCGDQSGSVEPGSGLTLQTDRESFVGDAEFINFEGTVTALRDCSCLGIQPPEFFTNRGNVLIGTLAAANSSLTEDIPEGYPVYVTGYDFTIGRMLVEAADCAIPAKTPAIGISQFQTMYRERAIVGVTAGAAGFGSFVLAGDQTARFVQDHAFAVTGSTGNDSKLYRTTSSVYAVGPNQTTINVRESVPDATADGFIVGLGFVVVTGEVRNLDTTGYTINQPLYLAPGGGTTTTRPTCSDCAIQLVARVTAIDANDGRLIVFGSGRENATQNLTDGYIWVGDSNNQPEEVLLDSISGTVAAWVSGKIPAKAGCTRIPWDNTTPLITEGTELWSDTLTPKSVSNKVVVQTSITVDAYATEKIVMAVFRDSTCIGSTIIESKLDDDDDDDDDDEGGVVVLPVQFTIEDSPNTTSQVTYSVRIGRGTSKGAWYVNRTRNSSTLLGGTLENTAYVIMECK